MGQAAVAVTYPADATIMLVTGLNAVGDHAHVLSVGKPDGTLEAQARDQPGIDQVVAAAKDHQGESGKPFLGWRTPLEPPADLHLRAGTA